MSDLPVKRICVVGLGYIGLPTAAMFASRKVEVVGVDVNRRAVDTINRGEVHIVEPDLDMVVRAVVREGYLRATTEPEPADAFLIAVPTPFKGENHEPDLKYVAAATRAIAPVLKVGNLVILESTSPVGATEAVAQWLAEARPDLSFPQTEGEASDIRVAHCPERVLPGSVMQELITNDRVIGGMTKVCSARARELYETFVSGDCVIASGPRVAEMAKLTENSFRDVNIAFANELSIVSDKLGVNIWELIRLANLHPRVNILQPGPGVGGHCIAVDPWFIVSSAPENTKLIRAAREVNDGKPEWVTMKIKEAVSEYLREYPDTLESNITVTCFGLSFKANIDDLRESPALEIATRLSVTERFKVCAVEPHIPQHMLFPFKLVEINQGLKSEICVLLVDHVQFSGLRPSTSYIVDARGLWSEK